VSKAELTVWIHEKIKEHIQEARDNNHQMFKEVDRNGDGYVTWDEFRQTLKEDNATKKKIETEIGELLQKLIMFVHELLTIKRDNMLAQALIHHADILRVILLGMRNIVTEIFGVWQILIRPSKMLLDSLTCTLQNAF